MVVAVTLDRFVLISSKGKFATRKIAIITVICIILCMLIICGGLAFRRNIQWKGKCEEEFIFQVLIFQGVGVYVTPPFYSFLPIVILCIFNLILAVKLLRLRRGLTETEDPSTRHLRKTRELTITVLVMSVAYTVLTLPHAIYIILSVAFAPGHLPVDVMVFVWEISKVLVITNNSINFYLYVLTSRSMRLSYIKLWRRCCGCQYDKLIGQDEELSLIEIGQVAHALKDMLQKELPVVM
jgi:growth hormone secretagogue receptor